jgi:autotransporter strand-loop-strand O-heptosyltransferase
MNLENVKGFHGHDDLNVAIDHIVSSRFFVGLSSGLSWLAWAYDVPVVMISNFTKKQNEFDCFRVTNPYVCNGCFNMYPNIKSNCPIFLGTEREHECQLKITPEMVIDEIKKVIIFTNE